MVANTLGTYKGRAYENTSIFQTELPLRRGPVLGRPRVCVSPGGGRAHLLREERLGPEWLPGVLGGFLHLLL